MQQTSALILLTLLLLTACSTPAPDSATDTQSSSVATTSSAADAAVEDAASTDSDADMICRMEIVTGSNRRREVCLTRAQRREIQRNSRDEFNRNRALRD